MVNILVEVNHAKPLDKYGYYFRDEILQRGWGSLLYEDANDIYCQSFVRRFYDNLHKDNIHADQYYFQLDWDGETRTVTPVLISEVTGIPLTPGTRQTPMSIVEYMRLMGRDCRPYKGSGWIQANTVFRNVYAVGRWVKSNVRGDSHVSSFYRDELHVIHMLMTRDPNFCICRHLFESIIKVKTWENKSQNTSLVLPCLVTKLVRTWVHSDYFNDMAKYDGIKVKPIKLSPSFGSSLQIDWVPGMHHEDVPATSVTPSGSSSSTGVVFSIGTSCLRTAERENILFRANKAVYKMMKKIMGKKKKSGRREEATSTPVPEPLRELPIRA